MTRPTKERLEEIRASWWKFPTQMWVGDLFNGIDALEKERDEWKKLVDYITELPCCDSKYPGCKVCSAIDLLVHSGLKLDKPDAQAAPRCKHDIHGNDCVKCYPSEVK